MSVEAVESGTGEDLGGSLSEHEAQFGKAGLNGLDGSGLPKEAEGSGENAAVAEPEVESGVAKEERSRYEAGKFAKAEKHRAESQKASAEDVPRIRELTRKLREAERALEFERSGGVAKASQPVAELSRHVAAASQPVAASSQFTEKAPKLEDFSREEDPYGSWLLAMGRFERKQERFEADQAAKAAREVSERESLEREANETQQKAISEYSERLAEFKESHTDFDDVVRGAIDTVGDLQIPPLAQATMLLHDKGPEMLYYLCRNSDAMDDFLLLTDGKAITDGNVALATRFLERRLNAAATGSATPTPQRRKPPTPPNPVRTVPSQDRAHDDEEGSSLQDHERKYGRQRR